MNPGERIRVIRLERGLHQYALARLAGVEPERVRFWEQGDYRPNWDSIIRLCRALNCTPNELMGWGNDEIHTHERPSADY